MGSIGGGMLEARVIKAAESLLGYDKALVMEIQMKGKEVAGTEMICGGNVDVLVQGITPSNSQAREILDAVLDGFLENWRIDEDLVILISDHGNIEDLQARGHTRNPVPCLIIGPPHLRREFARDLHDLSGYTPSVLRILIEEGRPS